MILAFSRSVPLAQITVNFFYCKINLAILHDVASICTTYQAYSPIQHSTNHPDVTFYFVQTVTSTSMIFNAPSSLHTVEQLSRVEQATLLSLCVWSMHITACQLYQRKMYCIVGSTTIPDQTPPDRLLTSTCCY